MIHEWLNDQDDVEITLRAALTGDNYVVYRIIRIRVITHSISTAAKNDVFKHYFEFHSIARYIFHEDLTHDLGRKIKVLMIEYEISTALMNVLPKKSLKEFGDVFTIVVRTPKGIIQT